MLAKVPKMPPKYPNISARPYATVLRCAEPSASEACLAHANVRDVRAGVCGVSPRKRLYQGRACAFCGDGTQGTLRSFRAHGKCKVCPDVLWLPYLFAALVIFLAGPALRSASQMQDGFGAINIAVAFSQIIAIFRQLDLQWPDELLDLFNMISFFNLNVDLLSIDCFVSEWSFTRKFLLANLIPVLFGLTFLIRVVLTVFHNTYFLPKVYLPAAKYCSRILGIGSTVISSTTAPGLPPRSATSSQAAMSGSGSEVLERNNRKTNIQHPTVDVDATRDNVTSAMQRQQSGDLAPAAPEQAAASLMALQSFGSFGEQSPPEHGGSSARAVTEAFDRTREASTPDKSGGGGAWNRARIAVDTGGVEGDHASSWAVPSPHTPITPSRRIVQLVEHVSSPIARRVSRAASALLSEVRRYKLFQFTHSLKAPGFNP
jgi:hypothetical protein